MGIAYNEFVKRPGELIDYSPEMIEELRKCKNDIFHFLQYVKIKTLDEGLVTFTPYEFQQNIINLFQKQRRIATMCPRQSGKCVYFDTKIKIRNKKTNIEEEITLEEFFNKFSKK